MEEEVAEEEPAAEAEEMVEEEEPAAMEEETQDAASISHLIHV
jgi:hypothetical protein